MNDPLSRIQAEPALAWKAAVQLGGCDPASAEANQAARTVRASSLVSALFEARDRTGATYKKWTGAHWILSILADLGFPAGDESLRPLMEETFACWLGEAHKKHIREIAGKTRRCASQEGNAVWSSLKLGFADGRTDELVERLLAWQWQDGGWNCDKIPTANTSSFMETLIPLRALVLYAQISGDTGVKVASEEAAEVFLGRQLFRRRRDGQLMDRHFLNLHYPCYWHYDILFGLKVMTEAGLLGDPRCREALEVLEAKRLGDGGFPAEESYSRSTRPELSGYTPVSWGGRSTRSMNPFVSADALYVLKQAGRI